MTNPHRGPFMRNSMGTSPLILNSSGVISGNMENKKEGAIIWALCYKSIVVIS
jgi:hypothetical protein